MRFLLRYRWSSLGLLATLLTIALWLLNRTPLLQGQLTLWIFAIALLTLIPLAGRIGHLTDVLETYLGDRIGGLLGATFGNVPELAIGVALLLQARAHLDAPGFVGVNLDILRSLLLGSVVNNLAFVLGSAIFLGALRHGHLRFSASDAGLYSAALALAVAALSLPTATVLLQGDGARRATIALTLSAPVAVILIVSYGAYLAATIFELGEDGIRLRQLGQEKLRGQDAEVPEEVEEAERRQARARRAELRRQEPTEVPRTLIGLGLVSVAVAVIAGILVSVTDNIIVATPLTPLSVGFVLFPVICNLGEQAGAITEAWRNRMQEAMAISASSAV